MQVLIYIDINSKFSVHKNDDLDEVISRSEDLMNLHMNVAMCNKTCSFRSHFQ